MSSIIIFLQCCLIDVHAALSAAGVPDSLSFLAVLLIVSGVPALAALAIRVLIID